MRNCKACRSVILKSLIVEKSRFTCLGAMRLFRPQLPYWPGKELKNAAGFSQWSGVAFGRYGLTPATQLSRVLAGTKLVPAESHDVVSRGAPLCARKMLLSCHPPTI